MDYFFIWSWYGFHIKWHWHSDDHDLSVIFSRMQASSWTMKFYSFDLPFNLMTFVLKLDLDIVKMYVCTENVVPSSSKVTAWTGRDIEIPDDKDVWYFHIFTFSHFLLNINLNVSVFKCQLVLPTWKYVGGSACALNIRWLLMDVKITLTGRYSLKVF